MNNRMDLNKNTMKRILLIISFTILLYWGLAHPEQGLRILRRLLSVFAPFLIGAFFAFIINVPLNLLERHWPTNWKKRPSQRLKLLKRPVCLILSTLLILGILFSIFFIVVPSLADSFSSLANMLPWYLSKLERWSREILSFCSQYGIVLPEVSFNISDVLTTLQSFVTRYGESFVDSTIGFTTSLFSVVINIALAFVFSLYILSQKELLTSQAKRLTLSLISEKRASRVFEISTLTHKTFTSFVTGQLTEAFILGSLCFIGMLIFRLPYAPVISVLIGFTALIPIFGAFIGLTISAFLILLVSPIKALWFVIFLLVLQQVEGNLIYPKVVGKSVGLPGMWVLAAVTVGGSTMGVAGMLISVPICSVLYTLTRQMVHNRLNKKGIKP